jgi:hypothetical protein
MRSILSFPCLTLFACVLASPASAQVTAPFQELDRLTLHWAESNAPFTPPVPGAPPEVKDSGHANMLNLGFTAADVDQLRSECKAYFNEYYGIDFDAPGTLNLADGTIVGTGSSAGAVMFGEMTPASEDLRVVIDTANRSRDNSLNRSYVVEDTGCEMVMTAGGGVYGGKNANMPRMAGDVMLYGYANIFNPQKPLTKAYLVERIKFKPAWPIRVVPVANSQGASIAEAIIKVEAEYIDKSGVVHYGTGLTTLSRRFDENGTFFASKSTVYSFPR